jgi:hypothetical protein
MLGKNNTPFAAIAFEQMHRDGDRMAVIAVRGRYKLSADGRLAIAAKQEIVLADEYQGDPPKAALTKVSDITPFRPAADITVQGVSYPPGGETSTGWSFSIGVEDRTHVLRCNGYRVWEREQESKTAPPSIRGKSVTPGNAQPVWRLGASQPAGRVPLEYKFAAGGEIIGAPGHQVDPRNPQGVGVLHTSLQGGDEPIPAAVIDSVTAPVVDPHLAPEPQGMAPVPPSWQWRQRYAGAYDGAWRKQRRPRLPRDFDYRFYQVAHPELIWPGFLRGDERFRLVNLSRQASVLDFQLPGVAPVAKFEWLDEREVIARLNLDGAHIDMREGPPWSVDLTWRAWIAICPRFFRIDLGMVRLTSPDLAPLPIAREAGLEEVMAAPLRARP